MKLSDETIYTGQALPDYSFEATPVNGTYAGSDTITDFTLPNNTNAMDGTSIVSNSDNAGTYAIQGSYSSAENSTTFLSNYNVIIQNGTLTIKQDPSDSSWYYLEGATSGNQPLNPNTWYNEDVYVKLDPANATESAGSYDEISETALFTNSDKSKFLVTKEDANTTDMYFRIDPNGGGANAGAISSKQSTTIKIDKTAPKIKGAKGTPSTNNAIETLINIISFNTFFKPGVDVIISTEDPQPQGATSTVSVSGVQKVDYTIYEVDEKTGVVDATKAPTTGSGSVDANGDISFKIPNIGAYKVCAIATDQAGNPSGEECYYINVKKINIDVDNDGTPDLNDSDGDGCPDLNIKWYDSTGTLHVMNSDRDYDGIPDLNIDSDGDGIADLNVDTDGDGKPDLNLVMLKKSDWKPTKCVTTITDGNGEIVEYCTGTNVKPQINVDTTGNGIPNINIDTDGDFKADFNIDTDDDGEPDLNIGKVHEQWKPEKNDCIKDGFVFDTATDGKPLINIDTNGDGYPDINIDLTGDGKADINIDIDGDGIPDIDIDSSGDGKPDINIDTTGDGNPDKNIIDITEWIPDKIIEGEIPYGTIDLKEIPEIEDNGIIISKPSGGFLPNHAIKVTDISDHIGDDIKKELDKVIGEQEVKKVYEVEYFKDNVTAQPDGTIIMRVPIDSTIENAKVMIEQEDGTFKEVRVKEQDGYYVFETEHIGKVSILGDIKASEPEPIPEPEPKPSTDPEPQDEPKTKVPNTETPKASVQGSYTSAIGGASTGDMTNIALYMGIASFSIGSLLLIVYLRNKKDY